MSSWNRDSIITLLATNDKAIGRALVVLYNNQTPNEKAAQTTNVDNGKGFTGADAFIGTSMATFFLRTGYLSPKQVAYWRRVNKKGMMKIAKYARQLIEAIPQAKVVA